MKKSTILIVLALLCLFFRSEAQVRKSGDPLKVGDTIPDLTIQNVINYKSKSIRLSDFKDNLIILDFWSTSCVPCIKHMPVLDSLQKEFAGKVFFLPVNSSPKFDPPSKVVAFFNKHRKTFNLPSLVADTVLNNQFQPPSLGVYVWIKNGIIQQVTEGDAVIASNIVKTLQGESIKVDQVVRPDNVVAKSLFDNSNSSTQPSKYFIRSILFPFSPNLVGQSKNIDSLGRISRIFISNWTAYSLLLYAYPDYAYFGRRIKIVSRHPEQIPLEFKTDSAAKANEYCYEAIFPPVAHKKALEFVRQDLARYFPFALDSVKVTDSCWVLKLSRSKKLKVGDPKNSETNIEANLGLPVYFYNHAILSLAEALEFENKIPVLDETRYHANVWLDLPANLRNFNKVAKSLEKQGLILTKEIRSVEYLVIKDLDDNN